MRSVSANAFKGVGTLATRGSPVKPEIHPNYYHNAQVQCVCGNSFTTGSTKPVIRVEICSNCHPFYTGQQRIVDTAGQVERFQRRFGLRGQ